VGFHNPQAMMNTPQTDPVVDEIREIRRRISKEFGNDPDKLVAHYIQLQERYRDRLIVAPEVPVGVGEIAAGANSLSESASAKG